MFPTLFRRACRAAKSGYLLDVLETVSAASRISSHPVLLSGACNLFSAQVDEEAQADRPDMLLSTHLRMPLECQPNLEEDILSFRQLVAELEISASGTGHGPFRLFCPWSSSDEGRNGDTVSVYFIASIKPRLYGLLFGRSLL
ncbi:unnamed protein product [Protopolystoma xenopodis]|uniref:Uncharacterized protein n=1 Tax=Protopolystoma xenopodis TaxID=117903 RepID=A0A3S5AHR3_9PLAT|nr:unnamed protein product [Protopolystoma xenopodis]